ncbi:hypothetical protein SLA2020_454140 [Shorea laevis]
MVAGKVRMAMGLQKSPARSKQEAPPKPPLPSPSSAKVPQKAVFSRSVRRVLPTLLRAGPAPTARRHGAAASGGRAPREGVAVEDGAPGAQAPEGVRRHCPGPRERDLRQGRGARASC